MHAVKLAAALCVALTALAAGCKAPPAEPDAAPRRDAAVAKADPGPTLAERRARYDGRTTVELPAELPPAWRKLVARLDARPTRVRHEVRTTSGRADWRAVELELRMWGLDAAVEATLRQHLASLELPGFDAAAALPDAPVDVGPVRWSVDVGRLVAPVGEPREHLVTVKWRRTPDAPDAPVKCRKPYPVEAPAAAPGWLTKTTSRRSTRQRITAAVELDAKARRVALRMLFRNGFAHDEHVGHLAEGAARAGFERQSGEGPRQRWTHPDGATFEFAPDTADDLGLGCTLAGPVIAIELVKPAR